MSVNDLLTLLTQGTLFLIAVLTLVDFLRYRDRTRLDIALMFGALAAILLVQAIARLRQLQVAWLGQIGAILLLAQPYLLLRLVLHFRSVPRPVQLVGL